jgi:TetR/AcrR family transcriptional regulator, cholesterol catabolism regulator
MPDELARQIVAAKTTKRATKELIYEHALRLFAENSYARTGLRDIAEAVGVEVASLYTHIAGKNELLFDLMDFGTRDLLQRLMVATQDLSADPVARMYMLIREHVATNCRRRYQTLVAFNEIRELGPQQRRKILPLREKIERLYIDCVEEAIALGQMRNVNVRIAVNGIIAMGRGAATWYKDDGPMTPEEIGAFFADQALRGLLSASWLANFGDDQIDMARITSDVSP